MHDLNLKYKLENIKIWSKSEKYRGKCVPEAYFIFLNKNNSDLYLGTLHN